MRIGPAAAILPENTIPNETSNNKAATPSAAE